MPNETKQTSDEIDYSLTPEQDKAFKALKRAFKRCSDNKLYVWDYYGHISAVDGNKVRDMCPGGEGELADTSMISEFTPCCLHGATADDTPNVELW